MKIKNQFLGNVVLLITLLSLVSGSFATSVFVDQGPDGTSSKEVNPKDYPLENFSDSDFNKEPRVQFHWGPRGSDKTYLISMKLDGTDIRRVIEREKLNYDDKSRVLLSPMRSPNRHYLAYAILEKGTIEKNIINLITGEIIKLVKLTNCTRDPKFSWSPKNDYVFASCSREIYRYYIPGKKLVKLEKQIPARPLYALPDNKTLIGVTRKGLGYYDYDGNELSKHKLGISREYLKIVSFSLDGKFILFRSDDVGYIYNIKSKPESIEKIQFPDRFIGRSVLVDKHRSINISTTILTLFDVSNNKELDIFNIRVNQLAHLSILK